MLLSSIKMTEIAQFLNVIQEKGEEKCQALTKNSPKELEKKLTGICPRSVLF